MRTLTSWLLGGALAASLTWNWTSLRTQRAQPVCASTQTCCLEAGGVALAPAVEAALVELCDTSCGESDRLERRADELQRELLTGLSAPVVDPKRTAELVEEVSELRRRSLASCVQGILGVRAVLSPDEVRTLLERCEAGGASCR